MSPCTVSSQRPAVGQRLDALDAGQLAERVGWWHAREGQVHFVPPDVLQLGHAADAHEPALANDADAIADRLHLREDVRREEHGASVGAHLGHHPIELVLVERIEAARGLVEDRAAAGGA